MDLARGRLLQAGVFSFAGEAISIGIGGDPWNQVHPSVKFASALHRFDWLGDLMALGEPAIPEALRLTLGWRQVFGGWNAFSWRPDIMQRRLFNLACHAQALMASAPKAESAVIAEVLERQAKDLLILADSLPRAAERLCAVVLAANALPGGVGPRLLARALPRLNAVLQQNMLVSSAAGAAPRGRLELLLDLLAVEEGLSRRGAARAETVSGAIEALASRWAAPIDFWLKASGERGGAGDRANPYGSPVVQTAERLKERLNLRSYRAPQTAPQMSADSFPAVWRDAAVLAGKRFVNRGAVAAASMALRLFGLAARLALTLYIARYLGFAGMASYGFVIGASAAMVALSGLGLDYRVGRYSIHRSVGRVTSRVRDRILLRLSIALPALILIRFVFHIALAPLFIVLMEPVVYDIQQALIYQRRPLAANILLFVRSAAWVPFILALGLANSSWRSMNLVYLGWVISVAFSLLSFAFIVSPDRRLRSALMRSVDWRWLKSNVLGSKLVYLSELGFVAMIYCDRYAVAWLQGQKIAGIFVFLWSFTNALTPLVQAGVFNQRSPALSLAWNRGEIVAWSRQVRRGLRHTLLLSSALGVGVLIVANLARPPDGSGQATARLVLLLLMTLATIIRLSADWLQLALWSAIRDRQWVRINIVGLILSPIIACLSVSMFGLMGAGVEMLILAAGVFIFRFNIVRGMLNSGGDEASFKPAKAPISLLV